MANNKWGHLSKIKWVLIENAPYTASGLNEILAGAPTKAVLNQLAKIMKVTISPHGRYQAVKVESNKPAESLDKKKRETALEVGSPEHDAFVVEQVDRMAAQDVRITLDEMPEGEEKDILEEAYKNLINPYRNSKKEK